MILMKNFYAREYQNFVFSSTYSIISKCISRRNLNIDKIVFINCIELYQYCQKIRVIRWRCRWFFLRVSRDDIFSMIIDNVFFRNYKKKIYRRIYRLKLFNFKNIVYMMFSQWAFIKEFFVNCKISRNRT